MCEKNKERSLNGLEDARSMYGAGIVDKKASRHQSVNQAMNGLNE